ncbi:MAG TPA: thiamine pyrophosphate-requiring protein [Candidatus Acidoferrales bacterium]|nr:thiamine pyrophosphate-requiring protein [Candidatus Acidoferrales bacterium]
MTVSDFLIERLHEWGVRRIFGYPGDGCNGIIAALHRAQDKIDFIQVRHEEQAAFMACAHAKFTGEIGVCIGTSGPGAIHLLNGLYDAKNDHTPVLALTGQSATTALGSEYQQEVDLENLFKDVANAYLCTVVNPAQARHAIDRAVRSALARQSVSALIFPKDIQEERAVEEPPHAMNMNHSSVGYRPAQVLPHERDLQAAANILNVGERVAMLIGQGAQGAENELIAVADRLQAGCAKALLGKAVLPDDLPWVTGSIGLLGTLASSEMMSHCDTLLMIGTNYPYAQFLPKAGEARGIQIDLHGERTGIRYATELNLQGDTRDTLRALLPLLEQKADRGWRTQIAQTRERDDKIEASRAAIEGQPINPEDVFVELNKRLPSDVILTADAGTSTNWSARLLKMRRGMKWSLSGGLATMGSAVPYAIAAKFAFPNRPVVALTGDGAMQMNGINELITTAKYWQRWSDPRLVFFVANNRDLNQVTWEMRVESGVPKFPGSQDLPDFPYARYAELIGLRGVRVERTEDLGSAWESVLHADRPAVLEVLTDANISMLPPHIKPEQMKAFASAMLHGDPDEGPVLAQSIKGVLAGVFSGLQPEHNNR